MEGVQTSREVVPTSPVRRERLVIRDIDVVNFKSYYGAHRIGPLHKTFTAVIGPNGSGKSNVIDSMLFVFGRNAKKIRLEKLSELIHNSAAHPSLSYASVTVNFVRVVEWDGALDDPLQREEVPNSELRIKREVYRSGVSQYFIDGARRSQKEVVDRLITEGVDLEHNRFLILQGEVEQIALMKPKAEKEGEEGLLEYLDDLIGTNEFVGRISAATAEAETAQVARLEALDKEQKLKMERAALDDAKNSTMAFVTKDNQLQKTLIVMCQLRMRSIEEKLVEPRRLLAQIDERITDLTEELNARRETKVQAEQTAHRSKKELAEHTKSRDDIRGQRQAVETQLDKLKSGADAQEKARKKYLDQLKRCKEDLQKAILQQQDAEREAAIHQQNVDEAQQASTSLQTKHDQMVAELLPTLRPLRQQIEEKRRDMAPFERAVVEAQELLRTAESRLEGLHANHQKQTDLLAQVEREVEHKTQRLTQLDEVLQQAEHDGRREESLRVQDAVAEVSRRKFSINNAIQELKLQYRDGEADDRAMEFLLSQRSLKGYYGTLRQLGRIDPSYDIAAGVASTFWGYHVVEDRATATAALDLLKKNNIGRATMMVISEVEREMGPRSKKPFTCPTTTAQRLFDLIQPTNEKFRSVFYHAVRDTLVVPTLKEARETAFGQQRGGERYRVVSLKGELVEPSGTITGGGAAPRGAKLKAARAPQDKGAIKAELQRLQEELVRAHEEEQSMQLKLHQLHEQQSRLSPEQLHKLRMERHALMAAVDGHRQRGEAITAEVEQLRLTLESRRTAMEAEIQRCTHKLEEAQSARQVHGRALDELVEEEGRVGGNAFNEIRAALSSEQQRLDAEEEALRGCRRLVQRSRALQERKTKDVAEITANMQRLEEEVSDEVKEQIATCVERMEGLTRQVNAAEAQVSAAQAEMEEARLAVPAANSAVLEAQRALDDEQRYRQTESAKMADALQELAKFDQKIDGCEAKIKENADLYGCDTLQIDGTAPSSPAAPSSTHHEGDDDEDEDEEEDDANDDEATTHLGVKRPRRGATSSEAPNTNAGPASLTHDEIVQMSFRATPEELANCDYERSVHLAKALSEETKRLHSDIDFRAVALWRERDVAHRAALADYQDKKAHSDEVEGALRELKDRRSAAFLQVFERIRRQLKEVYQLLTHGGDADMELVDANDPFEGVNFVVRPPKKSWKQISNLSGGEKTLSSLALIFALHHIKPTPIYVLDEIDAALDFRNVSIVAHYVLRQALGAQFVIISLRHNMFEVAHQLVGVCKVNDVTTTLGLMPLGFQRKMERLLKGKRRCTQRQASPGSTKVEELAAQDDENGRRPRSASPATTHEEEEPRHSSTKVKHEMNLLDAPTAEEEEEEEEGRHSVVRPLGSASANHSAAHHEDNGTGRAPCVERPSGSNTHEARLSATTMVGKENRV